MSSKTISPPYLPSCSSNHVDLPEVVAGEIGFAVRYKSRYLYSRKYPREQAERKARGLRIESRTLLVVPSPLLMYGVADLLELSDKSVYLLLIEKDPRLFELMMTHIDSNLAHQQRIVVADVLGIPDILNRILEVTPWRFRRVGTAVLNGGYALEREYYDSVIEALTRHNQRFWQNRITVVRMARLWIRNLFENLALFPFRSVSEIAASNLPAVVVGAGESLEDAIPWIRKNRDRMLLFAVDTALSSLLELDIDPDYVVVVESQIANYSDFLIDASNRNREIEFIVDITSSSSVLRKLPGNPYFFISEFGDTELLDRIDSMGLGVVRIPPLGSVGVVSLYLALAMTTERVLMAGLDFSFRPGKTHARGTPPHRALLENSNRISPVDTSPSAYSRDLSSRRARDGSNRLTNLVLEGYSTAVVGYALQSRRIYDTNKSTILEGISHLSHREIDEFFARKNREPPVVPEVREINVDAERNDKRSVEGSRESNGDAKNKKNIRIVDFLNEELDTIRRVRTECENILRTPGAAPDRLDFGGADYLYFDFPDFEGAPTTERGFVSRIIASAFYYERILRRVIDLW